MPGLDQTFPNAFLTASPTAAVLPAAQYSNAGSDPGQNENHMTALSVLDLSPVSAGSSGAQALRNSIDLAALADKLGYVRFSNRPFEVKHFQTIHHCSVDVAHGLALLFGIGTMALPLWDSRTRWNNLMGDLTVSVTAGPSGHTNSPHPSSREGHLSTARWNAVSSSRTVLMPRLLPATTGTRFHPPRCDA